MRRDTIAPPSAEQQTAKSRGAALAKKVNKDRIVKFFRGSRDKNGFIKTFAIYALLICIGFIYLYPMLKMLATSFMSQNDLLDSSIRWIPSGFNISNYRQAMTATSTNYWTALLQSFIIAGVPTLFTLVSCSLTGYGLATFKFRGRGVIIGLIVLAFVLPRQVTMIPTYGLYSRLGINQTLWTFILPAAFANGLNASIFILIFWQFFRTVPRSLIEAAKIDGAGDLRIFFRIALRSAAPAFITVALFCFVWHWNEAYLTQLYVQGKMVTNNQWTTVIIQLEQFSSNAGGTQYSQTASTGANKLSEAIKMAASLLAVLPLIIIYGVFQRHFVESIDRTGITGE